MVVLGLVILSFVFAGVGGYMSNSTDAPAAEVNGEEISINQLERAYQNERARLEQQFGDAFAALAADADYLKQFREGILNRLIGEKLVEQAARELGLRVSDSQLREAIVTMPEFQIAGQFNNDRFQALLRQAGYQPNTFREYLRNELTRQQVAQALIGSEFTLPGEARNRFELVEQTRDIKFITVPAAAFAEGVELNEEEINAYYEANLDNFDTNERVAVAYVELKRDDLLSGIEVTEQEMRDFYEQSAGLYREEEERRVSHILIEFGEDKEAAKAKAQEILQKVNAGEEFAALAKENSDDTFSAENGGDLEWIGRDMMDPQFEQAAFGLQTAGDVSEVVETEFGFHIIKLTEIKEEQITPFEDVREDIAQQLKTEKATDQFYELQARMAELAFEVPDTLQDIASELDLEIKQTKLFERNTAPQPIANPVILANAFSQDLIDEKFNSDVLEVSDEHVLVLRVIEHEPERTKALEEVSDLIRQQLTAQKAQEAAQAWAEEVKASLQAGEDVSEKLAAKSVTWQEQTAMKRFSAEVDMNVVQKAFTLSLSEGQDKSVVMTNDGNVSLVQLLKVNAPGVPEAQQLSNMERTLQSGLSQRAFNNLVEALKARADIDIYI